jgi:hypothetical protein
MSMKVLVACEFSGVVRDAFIARGHDAISCDFLPSDRPGPHYRDDVIAFLEDGWDMMIAFPPCTYLCAGGNNWLNRRPDLAWRENREVALEFVESLLEAPIERIALENPIGAINSRIRKPDQIIRPWMFGHEYNKDICLWLKNLPPLVPTHGARDRSLLLLAVPGPHRKLDFWSSERNPGGRSRKSITFQGIADAMADQWGGIPLVIR